MNKSSSIRNISETEAWIVVYYLYNLVNSFKATPNDSSNIQELFLALTKRLDLSKHLSKVLNNKLDFLQKQKKLKLIELPENRKSPYDIVKPLSVNYEEDYDIYEKSGCWNTDTE